MWCETLKSLPDEEDGLCSGDVGEEPADILLKVGDGTSKERTAIDFSPTAAGGRAVGIKSGGRPNSNSCEI